MAVKGDFSPFEFWVIGWAHSTQNIWWTRMVATSQTTEGAITQQSELFNMVSLRAITISSPYYSFTSPTHVHSSPQVKSKDSLSMKCMKCLDCQWEKCPMKSTSLIQRNFMFWRRLHKFTKLIGSYCTITTYVPRLLDRGLGASSRCHRQVTYFNIGKQDRSSFSSSCQYWRRNQWKDLRGDKLIYHRV